MWCLHSKLIPAQLDTIGLGLNVQEAKLEHFGLITNYIIVGGYRNVLQFLHSASNRKKTYNLQNIIYEHLGYFYGC